MTNQKQGNLLFLDIPFWFDPAPYYENVILYWQRTSCKLRLEMAYTGSHVHGTRYVKK